MMIYTILDSEFDQNRNRVESISSEGKILPFMSFGEGLYVVCEFLERIPPPLP